MSTPSEQPPIQADHGIILPPPEGFILSVEREPRAILAEAAEAAAALKQVIESRKKTLAFNGETYLRYEDWQTAGRFFGLCARVDHTKAIRPLKDVHGYFARAEAIEIRTGRVISAAEAMCLTDEKKWKSRPVYGFTEHTSKRVKIGDEPVPLFQLRSMAQTRACAKALRNVLSWIVVLAGYAPTPAEEMDDFNQEQVIAHCAGCDLELFDAKEIADSRARFGTATCKVCVKKIDQRKAVQTVEQRRTEYAQQAGD